MRYTIKQDIPGRLRLRCGGGIMDVAEANGIAEQLRQVPQVLQVQARSTNGSVLVMYKAGDGEARARVLQTMDGLRVLDLPRSEGSAELDMPRENARFVRRLLIMLAGRYARRMFLPYPLQVAWVVAQSARFIAKGLAQLLRGRLTIEVLDATAIAAAMLQRDFKSAATVMLLLRISELMEEHVNARTRIALQESLLVRAETVWGVDDEGNDFAMNMDDVEIGQLLRVRMGASLPVDGTVVEGEGEVNEASMTGESALVHKRPGSTVFAGTVAEDGDMVIRTEALPGASRIDHIVRMVEESQELKAGVQSRAEHLADSLVPFSFLGFFAVLALTRNIMKATSVLMVDYSCAIKLSMPVAVMSAMREASNRGIIIKGGKYLEALADADVVVFDKTGTLTEAAPKVEKIIVCDAGDDEADLLRTAACLEEHYPHSLARAVVQEAIDRGIRHAEENHEEVEYIVAHGIASKVDGKRVLLGSAHFIFDDNGIEKPEGISERLEREAPTASTIFMAVDETLRCVLCIADPVRSSATRTIRRLHELGIGKVVMLTGDSEICARTIAAQVGIDEYRSQVLPEDKAVYVEGLKRAGRKVIMVGDGINDSPALAAADVSVALNDASDIARAVADVSVQNAHLDSLITMRRLATALMARINADYRLIVGFNTALIVLGVAGVIAPTVGAFAHNISTVGITAANTVPLLPEDSRA
ncbi:heavy metal translocating P-type ATPase [Curtanaerobium respiraculi]|uniref:heavy metal translocating P-type ATPase n=1 Tax=Curtanaerobium respiraculi TaxID=2949669 RepID=UPI0024B341C8|nr:heavy metal translocating P-type ATPase [Curtanaerobium respiraculi]